MSGEGLQLLPARLHFSHDHLLLCFSEGNLAALIGVAANCWEVNKNWEDFAQFCLCATDPDSFLAVAEENPFPLLALDKSCLQKVFGEITPSLPTAAMGNPGSSWILCPGPALAPGNSMGDEVSGHSLGCLQE